MFVYLYKPPLLFLGSVQIHISTISVTTSATVVGNVILFRSVVPFWFQPSTWGRVGGATSTEKTVRSVRVVRVWGWGTFCSTSPPFRPRESVALQVSQNSYSNRIATMEPYSHKGILILCWTFLISWLMTLGCHICLYGQINNLCFNFHGSHIKINIPVHSTLLNYSSSDDT